MISYLFRLAHGNGTCLGSQKWNQHPTKLLFFYASNLADDFAAQGGPVTWKQMLVSDAIDSWYTAKVPWNYEILTFHSIDYGISWLSHPLSCLSFVFFGHPLRDGCESVYRIDKYSCSTWGAEESEWENHVTSDMKLTRNKQNVFVCFCFIFVLFCFVVLFVVVAVLPAAARRKLLLFSHILCMRACMPGS